MNPPESPPTAGRYPIDRRAGEIERLDLQADALAFDASVMLDQIGVGPGWRCLDLACGPGGITRLLSERVGPEGRVAGLDADPVFLARARERLRGCANVEFVSGNAYRTGLAEGDFDLVHVRFLASTAGEPGVLIAEMMRLARAGGTIALQEPDVSTLNCYPSHPAWDRLRETIAQAFVCVGADVRLAQRLYQLARHAGLEDVHYRPFLVGVRSCDPMVDYLPATAESLRATIVDNRLMSANELDATLSACRAHLAEPGTVFTTYTVAQVWGRSP